MLFICIAFIISRQISSYVQFIKYLIIRRLKNKCKCDRSEDGEEDEQQVKESSGDEEKKIEQDGLAVEGNDENSLTRTPCHDSGIDIRDSLPAVSIIPTKKVR